MAALLRAVQTPWGLGWLLVVGLLVFACGWLLARLPGRERIAATRAQLEERTVALERALDERDAALADARQLSERVASLRTALDEERRHASLRLRELGEAREQLALQFRSLAADVLDETARQAGERQATQLGSLLDPLRQRIVEFRARVDEIHARDGQDRAALGEQVRQLAALNQQLGREAADLSRALKGQSKAQGTWGELVLERVLEAAGLRLNQEYSLQVTLTDAAGRRQRPDALIHLPGERVLVVDAKASMTAWEQYVNTEDEPLRAAALRRHVESMRSHLRELGERGYEALHGARSPDFVVMFVPIESAFTAATAHEPALWQQAWERNVLIVGPASLLFVVRTVAQLWREVRKDRNAHEIARRGAELYDRFVAFVTDLERVGERLRQATESWETAASRLSTGRGNLVRQAEGLRELGVKPARTLPESWVERATGDLALDEVDEPGAAMDSVVGLDAASCKR